MSCMHAKTKRVGLWRIDTGVLQLEPHTVFLCVHTLLLSRITQISACTLASFCDSARWWKLDGVLHILVMRSSALREVGPCSVLCLRVKLQPHSKLVKLWNELQRQLPRG
eukprot:2612886-Pleurochrysis_carterae.AAC.1